MGQFLSVRDGGKTSEEGFSRILRKVFPTSGVLGTTDLAVSQADPTPDMTVDIAAGDANIVYQSHMFHVWNSAVQNLAITANASGNARKDAIVCYVDLAVVSSASNNNPNAMKFEDVEGTPAGSPTAPSDSDIQTAVGAGNPWIRLAIVDVANGAASITNANILNARTLIPTPDIAGPSDGWTSLLQTPNSVTYNGNNNYSLVFNSVDLTDELSVGMRLKATRTVTAPIQCTDLEASSSQYYNDTTVAGMTFTDDFVVSAWIKIESYANMKIASRHNGTSGWELAINSLGQPFLIGYNGGSGNHSYVQSYASLPLNKWIHIAAQLDMSAFTATPTTSYVMLNGVDVTAQVVRGGTNPTALIQAGNLEIGSSVAAGFFDGKIAQVAIYSAKVTQATITASITQTLTGSETSLISAYSFNNSINDLNTTNANNLTAQGSAVATNTDSPFAGAVAAPYTAGTTEMAEVFSVAFSTNTTLVVQCPYGFVLPTSGGISALAYSTAAKPLGWINDVRILAEAILNNNFIPAASGTQNIPGLAVTVSVPAGGDDLIASVKAELYNTTDAAYPALVLQLQEGATIIDSMRAQGGAANEVRSVSFTVRIPSPSSGSHTYKLTIGQDAEQALQAGVGRSAVLLVGKP